MIPEKKPFELSDKQRELRDAAASAARHILAYGGGRSGKTFGFTYCVVARALQAPASRHLICRHHNIDVRQAVMMDTFPTVMRLAFPNLKYSVYKQDQFVEFHNEAEIWFGGLDDKERIEKILGKEYATIYPNECSQIDFQVITTLRTRLAQAAFKENGEALALKAYYDLNPVGVSHWTYKEFVQKVRPDNGVPLKNPESRTYVTLNPVDNPNLPPEYHEELDELPERQRLRFKEGQYLTEVPGALWPLKRIDECRVAPEQVPPLRRIVVAVDPSGSDGAGGDSQGLLVVGKGEDDHAYVLEDATLTGSPATWARMTVKKYKEYNADCVVAEANYGGAMVEHTITTEDKNVKVKMVNASRGKHVRAEPVAALYEARGEVPVRAHHVGVFKELEEQMAAFNTDGYAGSGSPDRADALVWALTELMLGSEKTAFVGISSTTRQQLAGAA